LPLHVDGGRRRRRFLSFISTPNGRLQRQSGMPPGFQLSIVSQDHRNQPLAFWLAAIAALVLSQLSSYLIDSHLPIGETWIASPFLYITHVRNIGGTFGLFPGHGYLFAGLSIAVMVFCSIAFMRSKPVHWSQVMLFGFIIGGGAANVADRLIRGSVVDFINVQGIPHWQYIFNTADVFIHIGIWPTLLIGFWQARHDKKHTPAE